jgi:uncharacterized protein DUF4430
VRRAAALVAGCALVLGACSVGAGESNPQGATLTVSRDFGTRALLTARADTVPGGETVMRFLQRRADVDTGYGGRFVNAIEGVRSGSARGEQRDWFYYVNGTEASQGAAERKVEGGDRIWWDYRDWSAAMRVPAVVGSYPEPFLHGAEGKRFPVRIDCAPDADAQCDRVSDALERSGVDSSRAGLGTPAGEDLLRFVVGPWKDVRELNPTSKLEDGPRESGVFARLRPAGGGYAIDVLDPRGRVTETLGPGAGIVAATRAGDQQPTWTVSGTDGAGLARAVRMVSARVLRDRYAVAANAGGVHPLPAQGGAAG